MIDTEIRGFLIGINNEVKRVDYNYLANRPADGGTPTDVVTFDQRNPVAAAYIDTVIYDPSDYTSSRMTDYENPEDTTLEDPVGCDLVIKYPGTIYFMDEVTGQNWHDTVSAGTYKAYNLVPTHQHIWYVMDGSGRMLQSGSILPTGALRMIYLDGPHNFRDLGGWACDGGHVAYSKLFRGAQLSHNHGMIATQSDITRLRNCGIRCEIDLRTLPQTAGADDVVGTEDDITSSVLGQDVDYVQFPYSDASYVDIVNLSGNYAEQTKQLMRYMYNNIIHGIPTYFHCQAGADRTGVISFMFEGLLGVSQSDQDKDFELTSFYPQVGYERLRTNRNYTALVEYISGLGLSSWTLNFVQWFLNAGFSLDEVNTLRSQLIEGTPNEITPSGLHISYSVRNELPTGISTNNASTSVDQNVSYGATITADVANNIGIKNIVVRMGGTDITSSVLTLTPVDTPSVNTYTITKNLTSTNSSNMATSVAERSSYSTTLTAATGYTLSSVTVTMGGVDITSTVYSSGTINIPSVTGNVVITATSTAVVRTNMLASAVDTDGSAYNSGAGYKAGYRLNSNGEEITQSGAYVTGFMPCHMGDTVIFDNISIPSSNAISEYNICYIALYDSNKTKIGSNYSKDYCNLSQNNPVVSNNLIQEITMNRAVGSADMTNLAFIRFSALSIDGTSAVYIE